MKKNNFKEIAKEIFSARVTLAIVIINTVVYFGTLFLYKVFQIDLVKDFSQYHPSHECFRYYQIISSDFVHLNFLHLFNNMSLLLFFGISLESRLKPLNYLIFYIVSGIVAGLFQMYFNPEKPSAGASGALNAVFTFHLFYSLYYFKTLKIDPEIDRLVNLGLFIMLFTELFLVISFISNDLYNLNNPMKKIAHHAHLGGALMGMISFVAFTIYMRFKNPQFEPSSVYFDLEINKQAPPELSQPTSS